MAGVVLTALLALGLAGSALGQTCEVYQVEGFCSGQTFGDPAAAAACGAAQIGRTAGALQGSACSSSSSCLYECLVTDTGADCGSFTVEPDGTGSGSTCPTTCSASAPTIDILTAVGLSTATSGGGYCVNGCGYTNGAYTLVVGVAGTSSLTGKAVPTGSSCSGGTPSSTANCASTGRNTVCVTDTASTVVPTAVVNNDAMPATPPSPAGSCVSYASGGVACSVPLPGGTTQAPTTSGVVDTPVATEQTPSGGTVNYYSSSQVHNSSTPVATGSNTVGSGNPAGQPGGSGTGTGSSGSGSGSGTGSGDCDAPSSAGVAGCTGTTPSLTRSDTVQSQMQAVFTGLQSTPIYSAAAAIGASVGTGSCPAGTVSSTFLHTTLDFTSTMCTIFAANLSIMQVVADCAWALLAVFIVLSA